MAGAAADLAEPVLEARARFGLAGVALRRDEPGTASAQLDRAEALLVGAAPHVRAEVAAGRAGLAYHDGDPRYARYLLTEARDALMRDGYPDPSALLILHAELVRCHVALGDEGAAAGAAAYGLTLVTAGGPAPTPTSTGNPPSGTTWQAGTGYAAGATVTYAGVSYRCLQGHTAQPGWEPPNVPALWQRV